MNPFGHALVLGFGASGEAAARLLAREGTRLTVVDEADNAALRTKASELGGNVVLGAHELPDGAFDACIVSPGLALDHPFLEQARARALNIIPEFEFGWSRFGGRTIAVTGTNGKSTIVKWISEVLAASGRPAVPCGNFGLPVSAAVAAGGAQWLVIEVSSFQLETAVGFRADYSLLLNLLPNHLDRHLTMEIYEDAKARLFRHCLPEDVCAVHESCIDSVRRRSAGCGSWISFGTSPSTEYTYDNGVVRGPDARTFDLSGTFFGNDVLGQNAAGAVAVLDRAGIGPAAIRATALAFRPLPHRLEKVRELDGVTFVNDSKATTLTAVAAALRISRSPVRLIAGGLLKEDDLARVKKVLAERVSAIYLIGRASEKMSSAWSGSVSCVPCGDLETAVARAWQDAKPGETVLLSPGCASFDQFKNFADRGEQFRKRVAALIGRKSL